MAVRPSCQNAGRARRTSRSLIRDLAMSTTRLGPRYRRAFSTLLVLAALACGIARATADQDTPARYLYVAAPGVRNYLDYGGHGRLLFYMDPGTSVPNRIKASATHAA